MRIQGRDIKMTVGGVEIKGCSMEPDNSPGWDKLVKQPVFADWDMYGKGTAKIHLKPKSMWYLKNELFINGNRPPRGLRI